MTVVPKGLPSALAALWQDAGTPARTRGLTRERIVEAAIDLADEDGLSALSMGRLAQRLRCGTMSLYRHVANKDELITFMLSAAPGAPPALPDGDDWRGAVTAWADGLWEVYHRHPWVLSAAAAGPPADPGQLGWLDRGLTALSPTGLSERDKLAAVMAVLHYVRGAAALDVAAGESDVVFGDLLRQVADAARFPAVAAALEAGAFDGETDRLADFRRGLAQVVDGIAGRVGAPGRVR
ncbi:TetR/AcrR family transcriptional regulator [Mycobacterium sp. PS03-16]|uniref:TetR/AcrR family transcriptional regulator n=1 Tax=Mycobacterium sp. PS03-16 TaxID=2559611 RepID=UPI00107424CB|nr:TetR/AcrR family transcriptional regulator [Mycobacterium sp. PS03-16]TFV58267.1 TetR/AcrR family transcriptional regulator [Mycobacterium sp. PS03-16]